MTRTRSTSVLSLLALVASTAFAGSAPAAVPSAAKVRVTDVGFTFVPDDADSSFAGDVTGAAVVENPTAKVATDVEVTLTLLDKGGRTITDASYRLAYVPPGGEAYAPWDTTYPETKVPVEMTAEITDAGEMVSKKEWAQDAQYALGVGEFGAEQPIPIEDVAAEFSDLRYHDTTVDTATSGLASTIVGTASSASGEELTGLDVTCAAFENGDVTRGGHMVLPGIPAGGVAGIQANNVLGGGNPDELRCSARVEYLYARVGSLDDALVVNDVGFSLTSIDEYTMGAVVENPTDRWAWGFSAAFDVLDANGQVVGSRTTTEPIFVPPNSEVYVTPDLPGAPTEFAAPPAELRVLVTVGAFLKSGREINEEAGFKVADWQIELSDVAVNDSGDITGTITSQAKRPLNALQVTCGVFGGGSILGAVSSTIDDSELGGLLEPDEPTEFEIPAQLDSVGVDSVRCVGTITSLSDV